MSGLLVAAPSSGSGKTVLTLALLRALKNRGLAVSAAKAGPDYIDPAFHAAATGRPALNLDPFAMRPDLIRALAAEAGGEALVVEGMMGLFDGAADGTGSSADLAELLGLSCLLVVDCAKVSQSVAALVRGFRDHRPGLTLAGLLLNRVGSARHEAMLRTALEPIGLPVLGVVPRSPALHLPERHLGLVQAGEHGDLERFVSGAAEMVAAHADMAALEALARRMASAAPGVARLPPLGQRIAVARDEAFAFAYPHLLAGWREAGAELLPFSPLAGEAPDGGADAVFLPGGYPELHAGRLADAVAFRAGMQAAAARGASIYGECGGYMVLGSGLVDAAGERHAMLGLLPLETSFAARRLHLGYRRVRALGPVPFGGRATAHEFHYATILSQGAAAPLFQAEDALGEDLGTMGLVERRVAGSFLHLIDVAP
ncbi:MULTISPECIES: cobyrinate a,c-diamide synthase [unclassified Aureimonas]|uniref:cobyrinate a,c-diamide synthase n=1 Tax=unclassified Aureimonas TaxID=2615206 RepID=UPI0006FC443C|nr:MULTISPECIES: cobyrinate a,c-diamide synthase [unclassified Aureimonas]KQT64110.1 cobyrinic acid a,c-diamide synthase [Aureimonas sp. Leaf427]KQT81299.1 cobyrinic acid a,c-diamide synthase [Aureimonas sp. Leaf460]